MLVKKGWTDRQKRQLRRRDIEYWKKLINDNNISYGSLFYLDFPELGGKN